MRIFKKVFFHPLFGMTLILATVYSSIQAVKEYDYEKRLRAVEAFPSVYGYSPEEYTLYSKEYISRSVDDDDYCAPLESDLISKLGLAHGLCVSSLIHTNDASLLRKRLRDAFSKTAALDAGQGIRIDEAEIADGVRQEIKRELECLESVKSKIREAIDFPFSMNLPGLQHYRLMVSPGINYGEECNFLNT